MSPRRLALIIGGGLAVASAAVLWPTPEPAVRLLFTGDILLARQVMAEMYRTGESPLDSIRPLLATAGWVAGNLEGAIGPERDCVATDTLTCFAFPDTAPALLSHAGFKALFVENNHAADLGANGRQRTRDALRSAGLLAVDFDHSPRFVRLGDLTVAVVAVSLVPGADGRAESVPSVSLSQKLRLARTLANLVVVSIHWGTELQDWPSEAQRATGQWLVDHGADLVIGHHPHVVQEPACVHGRPVFYSLGNFVFDQRYPQTKAGLIADCTLVGRRLQCGALSTHARSGSAVPVISGRSQARALAGCEVDLARPVSVSGYTLRPAPWYASAPDDRLVIEGWKAGAVRWVTRRVDLVSLQAGLTDTGGAPLLLALERHPSTMDGEDAIRPHVYAVGDRGFVPKWRGTALAWPLIDAVIDGRGRLCALHRGDSFIRPGPQITYTRTMLYRWNGFGFSGAGDSRADASCSGRAW
jgi:hypothetical protein